MEGALSFQKAKVEDAGEGIDCHSPISCSTFCAAGVEIGSKTKEDCDFLNWFQSRVTWLCWEGILEDRQEGEGSLRRAPSNRPLNPVSPILPILPFPVLLIHHELFHDELLHSEFYALHISSEFWTKFNCHLFILCWIRFVHLFFFIFWIN